MQDSIRFFARLEPILTDICEECGISMELSEDNDGSVVCTSCGYIKKSMGSHEQVEHANSRIQMGVGARKRVFNVTHNYSPVQLNALLQLFTAKHRNYTGPDSSHIPSWITTQVANQYNEIQRLNAEGKIWASHRASIKEQVLAIMIYFTCWKNGIARTRKEAKNFMGLNYSSGIARGERIVRTLHAEGHLDIVVNETANAAAVRFLESMGLVEGRQFIEDCVAIADKHYLSPKSQLNSKVVGALWVYLRFTRTIRSDDDIEKITCTRKTTFMKFARIIVDTNYFTLFLPAFSDNQVPAY